MKFPVKFFKDITTAVYPPVPSLAPEGEHDLPTRLYTAAKRETVLGERAATLAYIAVMATYVLVVVFGSPSGLMFLAVAMYFASERREHAIVAKTLRLAAGEVAASEERQS